MSNADFFGPGLTPQQWGQLKGLATSLSPEQAKWISGYFTGFADAAGQALGAVPEAVGVLPATAAPAELPQRGLTVLHGGETGNGAELATAIAGKASGLGLRVTVKDMAGYKPASLKDEEDLLVIVSTHGEGDAPQPAAGFFDFLAGRKAPKLQGVRFAVLALGDSTYEFFCGAGKRLDQRLEELGGQRLADRIDCDVDQLAAGAEWAEQVVAGLAAQAPATAPAPLAAVAAAPAAAAAIDKDRPFLAPVLENIVLTGRGSSKETRHVELDLAESGLTYEPGDALGIVAHNDARVVAELVDALGADGDTPVEIDGRSLGFAAALASNFEICALTPRFLRHWGELAAAPDLLATAEASPTERTAFLSAHHIVDIVRTHKAGGIAPAIFVTGLRRLQPRLYSIASSQQAQDGDAHLTVSTVRYDLRGSERLGVVSGALGRLDPDAALPVYIKPNPHFHLPADDVPIIMVGAGTGVAPYRAFVQERELRGAGGRSWLVFGERNFRTDFLYQTEWQEHLRGGALSRLDLAFSRDGADKTYVQHRLREQGRDIFAWLEDGAHFFVCGDAAAMAPDVHRALLEIVATHGGRSTEDADDYVRALSTAGRYQRDVY